jgi:hypothetical protein
MIPARILRDMAEGGRVEKTREHGSGAAPGQTRFRIGSPKAGRVSRSGPKIGHDAGHTLPLLLIVRGGVKDFGVDIGVGIVAGADSTVVGGGRKL